ncbi:snRNA-activating protein complex, subunit 3, partial [Piptocephalis cylindrospora]
STGDLETPLGHVPLRFGVPYLLCHQGHCEHYISFLDAKEERASSHSLLSPRITHASAIRDSENPYPMVLFRGKLARHRCRICNNYPAEYVTINDVMSGETPCFFCQYCFEPFHCDSQGNSLGQ